MRSTAVVTILSSFIFFLASCQTLPSEVAVSTDEGVVYCGQKLEVQTELLSGTVGHQANAGDFIYRAQRGTIEGNYYTAPAEPGEDSLTIFHRPSRIEKTISIQVVKPPRIVYEEAPQIMSCNATLKIQPDVFIGDAKEATQGDFTYRAKEGRFDGDTYHAPAHETTESILISYSPLKLHRELQIQVVAKPILSIASRKEQVPVNKELQMSPYFDKAGKHIAITPGELQLTAKRGTISGMIYRAPAQSGPDIVTILHPSSGQKIVINIEVEKDLQIIVSPPKEEIICHQKIAIVPQLMQGKELKKLAMEAYQFAAKKGSFAGNIYTAPGKENQGEDTITITHKESKVKKQFTLNVKYAPYVPISTDRFTMEIPTEWSTTATDMGLIATSSREGYQWQNMEGSEIKAVALPGFDFWDLKTIMILLQQQGGVGKHMERIGPDEKIDIAGQEATRVIFENAAKNSRRSWWIGFKREGAVYLFILTGTAEFFDDGIPEHIVRTFKFKQRPLEDAENLVIPNKEKIIDHPFFTIKVPETWRHEQLLDMLFASSKVYTKGEKVALMILSYRSREIQSMDPSLILLLVRQETVKDPSMKVTEEREIDIGNVKGQMLEFEGGQELRQKMWIIAAKHNFTGYALIIKGPMPIWEKNPQFANQIIQSFSPK